jgi:hypothetical protein
VSQLGDVMPASWVVGSDWNRADASTCFADGEICVVERSDKTWVRLNCSLLGTPMTRSVKMYFLMFAV